MALGMPTNSMPDYREDFALHFDIWGIDDEKLNECFSIFPRGKELLNRVCDVRKTSIKSSDIDDKSLLIMLDQMIQDIEAALMQHGDDVAINLNAEKASAHKRSIYRGNTALKNEVFNQADSLSVHLDDNLAQIVKKYCSDVACDAFYFLSEPLYQISGCNYSVSHWILWALVEDKFDIDPYLQAYELYKINAQAGWGNEELFVYIEE